MKKKNNNKSFKILVIVNDRDKSFVKPEYSVILSSAMMHPYKWELAEVHSIL